MNILAAMAVSLAAHSGHVPCEHDRPRFVPEGPAPLTAEELRTRPCDPGDRNCFGTDVFINGPATAETTMPIERPGNTLWDCLMLFFLASVCTAFASVMFFGVARIYFELKEAKIQLKIAEAHRDAEMCALADRELARDEVEKFKVLEEKNS